VRGVWQPTTRVYELILYLICSTVLLKYSQPDDLLIQSPGPTEQQLVIYLLIVPLNLWSA